MKKLGKKKAAKGKAEAKTSTKAGIARAIPPFNRSWDDGDVAAMKRLSKKEPVRKETGAKIKNFGPGAC